MTGPLSRSSARVSLPTYSFPARYQTASDYLDSFVNFEKGLPSLHSRDFRLARMRKVLSVLGNPERHPKILHIAGTKGKGSTAAFVAEMLRAAGYSVGLYTSPHLHHLRERIRVLLPTGRPLPPRAGAGQGVFRDCISEKEWAGILAEISAVLEAYRSTKKFGRLTYFEVLTMVAFTFFNRQRVDFVVLETGLGGRLDATNVAPSLVAGITSISLDHTATLGGTVKAIAREKAAIIKRQGQRVVVAGQPPAALKVIQARCQRFAAKAVFVGSDIAFERTAFNWQGQKVAVRTPTARYDLSLRLQGLHQAENVAVAIGLVEALQAEGCVIPPAAILRGARDVFWPGRFELVRQRPWVILDGAHNPYSLSRLAETVRDFFPPGEIYLILGVSADKDWSGICRAIFPVAREVVLTRARHIRAFSWDRKAMAAVAAGKKVCFAKDVRTALRQTLRKAQPKDLILVTGSIFLVSEARELMKRSF